MATWRWQGWWTATREYIAALWTRFTRDGVPLAAAALAFYLTISMVPLLLLLFSVAAYFISPAQMQAFTANLTTALGEGVGQALRDEVLAVVRLRGIITGLSLLIGLWAGSTIFVFVQAALNQIWEAREERAFWVRRGLSLLAVVTTGMLALLAIALSYLIAVLGTLNIPLLGWQVREVPLLMRFLFTFLLPTFLVALAFALLYRYLSARKISWRLALIGAVPAAILWGIVLRLFSWYTGNFADYSVLYGSLGGIILLMLWFNYSATVFLLGAEIIAVKHARAAEAGTAVQDWGAEENREAA